MAKKSNEQKRKSSIKMRLNRGYLIVVGMMIVSGVLSLFALGIVHSEFKNFTDKVNVADTAVKICRIDINITARSIREAVLNEDPDSIAAYKQKVEEKLADVDVELKTMKATGVVDEELYQKYVSAITEWATTGYDILAMVEAGDREGATNAILTECVPALDELIEMSKELDEITDELMAESEKLVDTIYWIAIIVVWVFILVAIVLALQIAKRIVASITEPLSEIEKVAQELTEGNLHSHLEYHSDDEIGHLAHSLRKSIRILGTYVDDIANTMGEFSNGNFTVKPEVEWKGDFIAIKEAVESFEQSMSETVKNIKEVAEQVENGSGQVSDSATDLAQGATNQASITQELTATIETVSEQVASNADNASEISKMVDASGVTIHAGNEKMKEMVTSMGEISEASEEIRTIIDTINSIAAQTNLLALNASIEAARAGEAGKGFAVVADQVSILASQSAEAARESNALIEASLSAVEKGLVIADETAQQLKKVAEDSKTITGEVNKIADALHAQNEAFNQINAAVDEINGVVQDNSATSEECAAASEEMSSLATVLKDAIGQFKVLD